MAKKTIFIDEYNNEIESFINNDNKVYLGIKNIDIEIDQYFIFDKETLNDYIDYLLSLLKDLK